MKSKTYKIVIRLIFTIFVCFFSWQVNAVYLDRNAYPLDDTGSVPVLAVPPITDGLLYLYNTSDNSLLMSFQSYAEGDDFNYSRLTPGRYSMVELSPGVGDAWICNNPGEELDYESCKSLSGFVNEFIFTIKYGEYVYDGGVDIEDAPAGGSIPMFSPQADIISPNSKSIFSNIISIAYKAFDYNDFYSGESKARYGLGDNAVSLFYTDKFTRGYELDYSDSNKILIGSGLKNEDNYLWDAKNLLEQKFYQIILRVVDKSGSVFQTISDLFTVDLTAPTFSVEVNPKIVKNEIVNFTIKSSEDLSGIPDVFVEQRGANKVKVDVRGSGSLYKASYKPVDGYDGTATIKVNGKDFALNTGDVVMSGGNFNVGINPPVKPSVINILNNTKVNSGTLDVEGTTREDTKIIATVNGKDIYNSSPDKDGNFILKNLSLSKNTVNGKNVISISSIDPAGSISEGVVLNVLYNIAPSVSVVSPTEKSFVTGMSTILIKSFDENNDTVRFRYEISKSSELNWQLIEEVPSTKINFNTTKFSDGPYVLRVVADDSVSKAISNTVGISIKNETSFFIRFYDGLRTYTKSKTATLRGIVFADKKVISNTTIKNLYYSSDGGLSWVKVKALDGNFDQGEERFSVDISGLRDGLNHILWKSKDSRGVTIDSEQPVIVDSLPPVAPIIVSPKIDQILTKDDNTLIKKNIFTFDITGNSEPRSTVHIDINNQKYNTVTSFDGFFKIEGVNLSKNGKYKIKIFAQDEAFNTSKVVEQTIIYDNPPSIVFTSPRQGRGISKDTSISWIMSDIDGDTLVGKVLSYRKIGGSFVALSKNFVGNTFKWDTSKLSGNNFEIKLEAGDGIVSTTEVIPFSIDHTSPDLSDFNIKEKIIGADGTLSAHGTAYDNDSGVEFVEYSISSISQINQNKNPIWNKVNLQTKLILNEVSFKINKKLSLEDGDYQITVRAVDSASNISTPKYGTFSVDTTGPRVGGVDVKVLDQRIIPEDDTWGVPNKEKIFISLSLEKDTKDAYLVINESKFILNRDAVRGLWVTELSFDGIGQKIVYINATDLMGNSLVDKLLFNLNVKEKSRIVSVSEGGGEVPVAGASIDVYTSENNSFLSILKPKKYATVFSDENGYFTLFLPAGVWDIRVSGEGYVDYNINDLNQDKDSFVYNQINILKEKVDTGWWSKVINMLKFK